MGDEDCATRPDLPLPADPPPAAADDPPTVRDEVEHAPVAEDDPTWKRLEDQLRWSSGASRRAKQFFQRFKVAELVVAAAVPVVAALQAPAAITATLAALVVIAEGLQQLFGWQRDWLGYRSVLQALKREKFLFLARADPFSQADRHQVLAQRVEALVSQENAAWTETHTPNTQPKTK